MSSRDNVTSPPLYTDKRKGEERAQQKEGYGRPKTGWGHGTSLSHTHTHTHTHFALHILTPHALGNRAGRNIFFGDHTLCAKFVVYSVFK